MAAAVPFTTWPFREPCAAPLPSQFFCRPGCAFDLLSRPQVVDCPALGAATLLDPTIVVPPRPTLVLAVVVHKTTIPRFLRFLTSKKNGMNVVNILRAPLTSPLKTPTFHLSRLRRRRMVDPRRCFSSMGASALILYGPLYPSRPFPPLLTSLPPSSNSLFSTSWRNQ